MSHKLQIVLPDPVLQQLHELAANAGERPATIAGQLMRNVIALAAEEGKVRPLKPTQSVLVGRQGTGRALWLEPYGGAKDWRTEMWGRIVALHGRYPKALSALKDGWWTDDAQTETLCGLAIWRAELDDAGIDPRDELAFQTQLSDYSHTLDKEGGGVTRHGTPDRHPRRGSEWNSRFVVGRSANRTIRSTRTWGNGFE
jgi:hypothetical protein